MTDLASLRAALAANLATLEDVQVSAYALSEPVPPAIQIIPDDLTYDLAMSRGLDLWRFKVQALVAFTADIGSQMLLDGMLAPTGSGSVKTALESDTTLGGLADNVHVRNASGYRLLERAGGGQLIVVEFAVEVHVSN